MLLDEFKTIGDVKEKIIYPQINTQSQCDYLDASAVKLMDMRKQIGEEMQIFVE